MKRFLNTTALKAVLVGVVMSGLVMSCDNALVLDKAPVTQEQAAAGKQSAQNVQDRTAQRDERGEYYVSPVNGEKVYVSELQQMTSDLSVLAKATAVILEEKTVRNWLYKRCTERFDGESNALWMTLDADVSAPTTLKNAAGGNGSVWSNSISHVLSTNSKAGDNNSLLSGSSVQAVRQRLEDVFNAPLHLVWMKPESWDKISTPIVAFVRVDVDPKQQATFTGFDAQGKSIIIDKETAKKRPVILISFNERTTKSGALKSLVNQNNTTDKNTTSVNAGALKLEEVLFQTYANYDELDGSSPEFWVEVIGTNNWGQISQHYIGERTPGSWITINWTLTNSTPDTYDIVVKYWEEDFWFFDDYIGEHRFLCNSNGVFYATGSPSAKYTW